MIKTAKDLPLNVAITPLTPIHLGTGEAIEPMNYVIEDGFMYVAPIETLVDYFAEHKLLPKLDQLSTVLGKRGIQALQRFFYEHRQAFIENARQVVPVEEGVAEQYRHCIGQGENANQLIIEACAVEAGSDRPLIPGSAIKGMLRTALLNKHNAGQDYGAAAQAFRYNQRDGKRETKNKNEQFQKQVLAYSSPTNDPLKRLKVSDTRFGGSDYYATSVYFGTRHRRKLSKHQQKQKESATTRLQCIQPGLYRAFHCEWQLISHEPIPGVKTLQGLAQDCNRLLLPQLQQELSIMDEMNYGYQGWSNGVKQLLTAQKTDMEAGNVCLLRLGKQAGAMSKTLDGLRQIWIMGKQGSGEYQSEPRLMAMAASDEKATSGLLPFGWALAEIQPPKDNAALSQYCDSLLN